MENRNNNIHLLGSKLDVLWEEKRMKKNRTCIVGRRKMAQRVNWEHVAVVVVFDCN